ncbi:hypothetical protein F8388_004995 [Cannabis sativa]|uniref:HVA22-like protein n=2 Tax=Cannabis sativa TaxID=3483 RepID=A0A7J6FYX2_CANSA|nr:hypothetical protein F8388_004995 [Cannabis sativa]
MGRNATYLGLPLFKSSKRTNDTKGIIDKTLKRVQGWKARLLSSVGKTCLRNPCSSFFWSIRSESVDKTQTKIRIEKPEMGSGAGSFLKVILKNFDVLAGPVVSLVYPLYASVRAIETKSPIDDQQWLTYWVLYSLITLTELTFAKVIEWIPIWSYAKLIVTCWLVIPYFSGAAYVYEHFVRPFFVNPHTINIWYVPRKKDVFSKPDDILTAAEKYIEENGPDAFEKIIHRADKSRRNDNYAIFS